MIVFNLNKKLVFFSCNYFYLSLFLTYRAFFDKETPKSGCDARLQTLAAEL